MKFSCEHAFTYIYLLHLTTLKSRTTRCAEIGWK